MPAGAIVVNGWEDELMRNLIEAPAREGTEAHPVWAMIGAIRGLDTDIDGILAFAGFSADRGPLFASCEMAYDEPLRVDVEYAISGRVVGLEQKVGRRTGPFELFTFELDLDLDRERRASRVTFVWALPGGGDDG